MDDNMLENLLKEEKKEENKRTRKPKSKPREIKPKEANKNQFISVEEFYHKGVYMEKEIIQNSDFNKEFNIIAGGKTFFVEIKYDLGRGKFQVWITYDNRRISLSFFPIFETAYVNTLDNICTRIGASVAIKKQKNKTGIGD